MTCLTCQIDQRAVDQQLDAIRAMDRDRVAKTVAAIEAKSDDALHSVYGHQVATMREVVRRVREEVLSD